MSGILLDFVKATVTSVDDMGAVVLNGFDQRSYHITPETEFRGVDCVEVGQTLSLWVKGEQVRFVLPNYSYDF